MYSVLLFITFLVLAQCNAKVYAIYFVLSSEVQSANQTGNWVALQEYYSSIFVSFATINYAFKVRINAF